MTNTSLCVLLRLLPLLLLLLLLLPPPPPAFKGANLGANEEAGNERLILEDKEEEGEITRESVKGAEVVGGGSDAESSVFVVMTEEEIAT